MGRSLQSHITRPLLRVALSLLWTMGGCRGDNDRSGSVPAPAYEAQLEWRIGSIDDPSQLLTSVGQVVISPDGRVYVSQPEDSQIRIYESSGELVGKFGRRGQGPGEFASLDWIGIRGDTLYASDNGNRSLLSFNLDGDFLQAEIWATAIQVNADALLTDGVAASLSATTPQVVLDDGTGIVAVRTILISLPSAPGAVSTEVSHFAYSRPYLHVDRAGNVLDTLLLQPQSRTSFGVSAHGRVFRFPSPFNTLPLAALVPMREGGVVVVDEDTVGGASHERFVVQKIGPGGALLFRQPIDYAPIPVSSEYLLGVARDLLKARRASGPAPTEEAIQKALIEQGIAPATVAPVTALTATQDGSIWIRSGQEGGEQVLWHIIDATGSNKGKVLLPSNATVMAAWENEVYVVELDSFEIPFVAKYMLH